MQPTLMCVYIYWFQRDYFCCSCLQFLLEQQHFRCYGTLHHIIRTQPAVISSHEQTHQVVHTHPRWQKFIIAEQCKLHIALPEVLNVLHLV